MRTLSLGGAVSWVLGWGIKWNSQSAAKGPSLVFTCRPKVDSQRNDPSNVKWIIASNAYTCVRHHNPRRLNLREKLTSQIQVNLSCQLAFLDRYLWDETYAATPTTATKAREYAEVSVNTGRVSVPADMVVRGRRG